MHQKQEAKGKSFCCPCKTWYHGTFCQNCALLCPDCTGFQEDCDCDEWFFFECLSCTKYVLFVNVRLLGPQVTRWINKNFNNAVNHIRLMEKKEVLVSSLQPGQRIFNNNEEIVFIKNIYSGANVVSQEVKSRFGPSVVVEFTNDLSQCNKKFITPQELSSVSDLDFTLSPVIFPCACKVTIPDFTWLFQVLSLFLIKDLQEMITVYLCWVYYEVCKEGGKERTTPERAGGRLEAPRRGRGRSAHVRFARSLYVVMESKGLKRWTRKIKITKRWFSQNRFKIIKVVLFSQKKKHAGVIEIK
jgi:hypothetical protein